MTDHYVVAVDHIDIAFIPREEATEEMLDIALERVISVMERREDVRFALEQALHYKKLQQRRPDLFAKVREYLKQGRMEFMGGMATTAETNFPNGECLIRNQSMGLKWVEENLGVHPRQAWLTDTFGMNPQIPQIFRQFGFEHVHATRFGGNMPYDMFYAEGLDGSQVLVIGRDGYGANIRPSTQAHMLCRSWDDIERLFAFADRLSGNAPKLVTYYIENEEQFYEYYLTLAKERGWKISSYNEYSEALKQADPVLPVVSGDLNPEFTGTFALRTPIKTENRKAENALMEAEMWRVFTGHSDNETRETLENAWWKMFFCQFHDVFTGSHTDKTFHTVMARYAAVCEDAQKALHAALEVREEKPGLTVCNNLPFPRDEWVEYGGSRFLAQMKPCSVHYYDLPQKPNSVKLREQTQEIANEYLRLKLDEQEGIASLEDAEGNVYIAGAPNLLSAQADLGGLQIESCEGTEIFCTNGKTVIGPAQEDDAGESVTMSGSFPYMNWNEGRNKLSWSIRFSLLRGEKGLRMKIELDWQGMDTRIRLKIPTVMEGRNVYYEVPFGVVRREVYRNRPTAKGEWPVQRFAAIENGKKGIALVNRGVAGVEQEGNTLATTLIRAYGTKGHPWVSPTELTCRNGKSAYEFMLIPYRGSYLDADVLRVAQAFNQPFTVIPGRSDRKADISYLSVDSETVLLSSVKPAYDGSGDMVIRLYESAGKQQNCTVNVGGLMEVRSSDVKEEAGTLLTHRGDAMALSFEKFEIKTLRIKRRI